MSFVHPNMAALAVGLALAPWLIHLFNRRRYRREPWAAMRFLLQAHRRSQRRIRLEQWLLLALRTAVILLVGGALARPYLRNPRSATTLGSQHCDRVIILDDSLSMQALRSDGQSAFEAARKAVLNLIKATRPGDGLAIITASTPPRVWMDRPVYDPGIARQIVESLHCKNRLTDLPAAIQKASEVLSRGDAAEGNRLVYVFSDLTRSSLDRRTNPTTNPSLPSQPNTVDPLLSIDHVWVIDAGPQVRPNLAISNLRFDGQPLGAGTVMRLSFDVANQGDRPVSDVRVKVKLDDRTVQNIRLNPISPDQVMTEAVDLLFSSPGPHRVEASLSSKQADILQADNISRLAAVVADRIPVLLVEGRPGVEHTRQALFYYRVALATQTHGTLADRFFPTRTTMPSELGAEILEDYAVIVLGHASRLSKKSWARLTRYVQAGGGLVVFLGRGIQRDNYMKYPAAPSGNTRLMPLQIGESINLAEQREPVRFELAAPDHVLLTDYLGHDQGGLLLARVRRYWQVVSHQSPTADAPTIQNLLRLTNGDPALLTAHIGKGRVLIWTLGANMTDSNLPAKPDFLPLMLNMTRFAAGSQNAWRNIHVGDTFIHRIKSHPSGEPVIVHRPDNHQAEAVLESDQQGSMFTFSSTDQPGFYRMNAKSRSGLFAVNLSPMAGDLRRIGQAEFKRRIGRDDVMFSSMTDPIILTSTSPPQELAGIAMWILIAGVLMETVLATSIGPRR